MSKRISSLIVAVSMLLTVNAFAWTPIQLSVWDGVKNLPNSTVVNGLKIGVPFSNDYWGLNQEVNGVEMSILSESCGINGVLLAVVNMDSKNSEGLQICGAGVANNFAGLAIAVYNEFTQGSVGGQVGVVNTAKYNSESVQVGVINDAADNVKGIQVGIINTSYSFKGTQVGIFNTNYRNDSSSLQIGLINYNEKGFLPVFPFFNYTVE